MVDEEMGCIMNKLESEIREHLKSLIAYQKIPCKCDCRDGLEHTSLDQAVQAILAVVMRECDVECKECVKAAIINKEILEKQNAKYRSALEEIVLNTLANTSIADMSYNIAKRALATGEEGKP